ncbi:hypothetical protein IW136_005750 [Coemansia sp. RSA 678]|nr:hypothetical protein IW136_005750 [Coemansia sp. RSA 678]
MSLAWIARFDQVPAIAAADNDADNNGSAENVNNNRTERLVISVSDGFEATNAIPHMEFMYAFVVDQVIGEIQTSPEEYAQVTDLPHQAPELGSAIISPWRDLAVYKDK